MSASHVHVMFVLSDTEPLTPARRMKEGKGAARQPGGLQSQSLLAHTSCFFPSRDVPSPWRPSGTRSLSGPLFFKEVRVDQEIHLRPLKGNGSIS